MFGSGGKQLLLRVVAIALGSLFVAWQLASDGNLNKLGVNAARVDSGEDHGGDVVEESAGHESDDDAGDESADGDDARDGGEGDLSSEEDDSELDEEVSDDETADEDAETDVADEGGFGIIRN